MHCLDLMLGRTRTKQMKRKLQDQGKPSKADSSRFKETSKKIFPSARQLRWSVTLLLVYFGLRLVFFSSTVSPYVPPDEHTHFEISRIFSKISFLPENARETYEYGLVTNIPYLYYWIMGRLLNLNFFGIPDLLFL